MKFKEGDRVRLTEYPKFGVATVEEIIGDHMVVRLSADIPYLVGSCACMCVHKSHAYLSEEVLFEVQA